MDAYIVAGYRTAIGKAPRGTLRFTRPDDISVEVIKHLLNDFPQIEKNKIDDIVVGNAFPEAETGMNMGRLLSLMSLDTVDVPGSTINRFCASGLEAIAIADSKIKAGIADVIIAGGAETMSMINMGGWRLVPNPDVAKTNPDWYMSMGLTSEMVAREYKLTREEVDKFGAESYKRAFNAIDNGYFKDQIVPITVKENYFEDGKKKTREKVFDTDECPRRGTTFEGLQKLKPVFAPEPMAAIPKVLKHSGMKLEDIDLFELNEAFATQSLVVIKELGLDPEKVNVNGGAIALGHPLGCTGTKLTVQILNELKRRNKKYGMVTMCIGTGQGAAGIFEML